MPIDLPAHTDKPKYNKGNWVPVGWKPLHVSPMTRIAINAHILRRRVAEKDQQTQISAVKARKAERAARRAEAVVELAKLEIEMAAAKKRQSDLTTEKHECFTKLKECIQRDSMTKKIDEEKKRRAVALLQLQQPNMMKALMNNQHKKSGGNPQTSSLISQQNQTLTRNEHGQIIQQNLSAAQLQTIISQANEINMQEMMSRPPPNIKVEPGTHGYNPDIVKFEPMLPPPPVPPPQSHMRPPTISAPMKVPMPHINTSMPPPQSPHHIGNRNRNHNYSTQSPRQRDRAQSHSSTISPRGANNFTVPPPPSSVQRHNSYSAGHQNHHRGPMGPPPVPPPQIHVSPIPSLQHIQTYPPPGYPYYNREVKQEQMDSYVKSEIMSPPPPPPNLSAFDPSTETLQKALSKVSRKQIGKPDFSHQSGSGRRN